MGRRVGAHGFRLYAHRGASRHRPENSLEAFRLGLEHGANALELDVHRTADGHFVVTHDPDGARTAGDPRPVRTLTLDTVRTWCLGQDQRVPTLEEVLDAFPETTICVDFKPRNPGLVPELLSCLRRHDAADRVTVASFHHAVVREVHRLGWEGSTALSRLEVAWLRILPESWCRRLIRGASAQIPTAAGPLRLDGGPFIDRCHRLGLRIDYWVINDPLEAARLVERGATGLMTDDPQEIAPRFALSEGPESSGGAGFGRG